MSSRPEWDTWDGWMTLGVIIAIILAVFVIHAWAVA